jgi:hypothetical protein
MLGDKSNINMRKTMKMLLVSKTQIQRKRNINIMWALDMIVGGPVRL